MQDAHLQSLVRIFSVYDSYNTLQYNSKKTTYNGNTLLPTFSTKLLGMPLMVAGRSNRLFTIKSLKKKQNSNNKNGGKKNKTTQARSGHLDDYDEGAEYKVTSAIIYTAVARSQISTPALLPPTAGDARVYERQRLDSLTVRLLLKNSPTVSGKILIGWIQIQIVHPKGPHFPGR